MYCWILCVKQNWVNIKYSLIKRLSIDLPKQYNFQRFSEQNFFHNEFKTYTKLV